MSDPETVVVEDHISDCDACRAQLQSLPAGRMAELARLASTPSCAARSDWYLPGFEIIQELGRGGNGVVYKAFQTSLQRIVAIKRIHGDLEERAERLSRFRREAEAVARLDHPLIIRIHELGEFDGQLFLVLEFAEKGSLADRLQNPIPPLEAANLIENLARAVEHAHARGIIHRDLKPSNVLLVAGEWPQSTPQNERPDRAMMNPIVAKISDFGLAKDMYRTADQTRTGAIVGTPVYMSPEQAAGRTREIGPSTDVYSLGAILYQALTSRPPFQGQTDLETLEQVRTHEPISPGKLRPGVPRDLETICLKCLEKNPAKRYRSAGDLADDIRRFLAREPIQARPATSFEIASRWAKRRPAIASIIAFASVSCIVFAATVFSYTRRLEQSVANESHQRMMAQSNLVHANDAIEHLLTRLASVTSHSIPELQGIREGLLSDAQRIYETMIGDSEAGSEDIRYQHVVTLFALGRLKFMFGRLAEAEANYVAGLKQLRDLIERFPEKLDYRVELARQNVFRGQVSLGMQKYSEAEAIIHSVIEMNIPPISQIAAFKKELAAAHEEISAVMLASSLHPDRTKIESHKLTSLALSEEIAAELPDDRSAQTLLAMSLYNSGHYFYKAGEFQKGRDYARRAIDTFEDVLARWTDSPDERDVKYSLSECLMLIGNVDFPFRPADGEELLRRAVQIRQELARRFPGTVKYQDGFARSCHELAKQYRLTREFSKARKSIEKAIAIREAVVAGLPEDASENLNLVANLIVLSKVCADEGDFGKTADILRRAARVTESVRAEGGQMKDARTLAAAIRIDLGNTLNASGSASDSVEESAKAIKILEDLLQHDPADAYVKINLLNAHGVRAMTLGQLNRDAEACSDWDRIVDLSRPAERTHFCVLRAQGYINADRIGDTQRLLDELENSNDISNDDVLVLMQVHAQMIAQMGHHLDLSVDDRQKRIDGSIERALQSLKKLDEAGYLSSADKIEFLLRDDSMKPLRDHRPFLDFVTKIQNRIQ